MCIRSATVSPLGDVMHFATRGRLGAIWEDAAAIANRYNEALWFGKQPLGSAEVDDLVLAIEFDADETGVANKPVDAFAGDGLRVAFEVAVAAVVFQRLLGHDDAHGRASHSEHFCRVGVDREADHVDERIGQELFVRSRVTRNGIGEFCRFGIHKPNASPGSDDRIERVENVKTGLGVEQKRALIHAVVTHPALEVAVISALFFASSDACLIETVARGACFTL